MEAGGLGDFGVIESCYLAAITLASAPSCTNLIVIFLCLLVEDWCTADAQRTGGGREEESVIVETIVCILMSGKKRLSVYFYVCMLSAYGAKWIYLMTGPTIYLDP